VGYTKSEKQVYQSNTTVLSSTSYSEVGTWGRSEEPGNKPAQLKQL